MADPLNATVVYAHVRGLLDLKALDFSPRGWTGLRLVLREVQRSIDAQVAEQHVLRLCAELQVAQNPQTAATHLAQQVDRLTALIRPSTTGVKQGTALDLLARWYIINAPGRLKALGVHLGHLESVLAR